MSKPASANRPLTMRVWYNMLRRACQAAGVIGYQVRHTGRENIPQDGGVLVVSNHQSHFDPPLVGMGVMPRRMNYLARVTLFDVAPLRWLIHSLDAIPINRDGLGLGGIKETLRRLKRGEMVLIFPEGTRTHDGEIGRFRPGFTTLAERSGAVILPVAIEGAYDVWPRCLRFPRFGPIHVHYGPPMSADEIRQFEERELLGEVLRRVKECQDVLRRHPCFAKRSRR
jgi:1-acyl-sn-glycerol-3-phosphate acyltransferase